MVWRAEACGNTFLVSLDEHGIEEHLSQLRRQNRWDFDSALVLSTGAQDVIMRVLERDGSESSMCGNGARAVAHLLDRLHLPRRIRAGRLSMSIDRTRRGTYCVPMGQVLLRAISPPQIRLPELTWYDVGGEPHAVAVVPDVRTPSLPKWGEVIVPVANCTIVAVTGRQRVAARTFERGVNRITASCGTGACAAAQAAVDRGLVKFGVVEVSMHGHALRVHVEQGGALLEGEAWSSEQIGETE